MTKIVSRFSLHFTSKPSMLRIGSIQNIEYSCLKFEAIKWRHTYNMVERRNIEGNKQYCIYLALIWEILKNLRLRIGYNWNVYWMTGINKDKLSLVIILSVLSVRPWHLDHSNHAMSAEWEVVHRTAILVMHNRIHQNIWWERMRNWNWS